MPFNKVTTAPYALGILESEVGLVLKTHQAGKANVSEANDEGRFILKAGTLYTDPETSVNGVVYQDYDLTEYEAYPISVVEAGRLRADRVAKEVTAKKEDFIKQGLYIVGEEA